jgi:hypothetical protein
MQEYLTGSVESSDWERIGPVLNTVMLELKDADREVLLLRFFQRRPLAEVGHQLGLTENAARMRVERALDRLRDSLMRRGITSSAAALGAVLAQQTVAAAPVGLATSITAASLAGAAAVAGGSTTLTLLAMTNAKAVVVCALVAAGAAVPIAYQHSSNVRLKAELAALRAQAVDRPQPQPSAQDADELERLRLEHQELLRLRGEVTSLRQSASRQAKNQAGLSDLERKMDAKKAALSNEAERARMLLAKSPEIQMLPANSWTNVGVATPAAALQTLNWAAANMDTNAFLSAVSWDPQARARAEELFATLPDAVRQRYGSIDGVILDWMLSHATPVASFRVMSQTEQGPDDVSLIEQHQYTDDRVRENTVQFHRDETGAWRQVLPQQMMPKLEIVLNDLAGTPASSGGK